MEMNTMKNLTTKLLSFGLTAVMLTAFITGCKANNLTAGNADVKTPAAQQEAGTEMKKTTGSWKVPENTAVTEEHKAIFKNMTSKIDGFSLEPVAFLGSQVVAGTNYCFLCESTVKSNGGLNAHSLVYIYVDLKGEASLLADDRLVLPGTENAGKEFPVDGGWSYSESTEITDKVKDIMNKATETLTGETYEPVAYIGSQVVAGMNHAILCKAKPSVKELEGESKWVLVFVYENLDGKCEITGSKEITIAVK